MTSEQSPPAASTGPYLTAAIICERVLQEKDGVLSAIRIVDQITHTIVAPLITFKSGRARGRQTVQLAMEDPSGARKELFAHSLQFEGEHRGANWVIQANVMFSMEGLYWFEVILEDRLVTKMPVKLLYQLMSPGGA